MRKSLTTFTSGFLINMAKKKTKEGEKEPFTNMEAGMYKGYSINWLRNEPDHPDFYLVAEFDSLDRE